MSSEIHFCRNRQGWRRSSCFLCVCLRSSWIENCTKLFHFHHQQIFLNKYRGIELEHWNFLLLIYIFLFCESRNWVSWFWAAKNFPTDCYEDFSKTEIIFSQNFSTFHSPFLPSHLVFFFYFRPGSMIQRDVLEISHFSRWNTMRRESMLQKWRLNIVQGHEGYFTCKHNMLHSRASFFYFILLWNLIDFTWKSIKTTFVKIKILSFYVWALWFNKHRP